MIEHYNAFISYKHAPLDTKVASEIQTRLERFRIPRAIQKSSGIQKFDRIFRDKEELLITSDLNETIEQALVNSDFLIVICSYATKESIWVQREIEFFLKTHSKNQVLTVVAEGEPVDVVPQILQERQVTVTLDDGSEETVTVPMEPLSCDYRGDFRKARKEELPRLAAAMLGCSYDELKQRQRQYRIRRMTAAFSAVAVLLAGLSVYFAWSASQIKENYLLSLQNQSQYLAAESVSLLENGDRVNAMLLALEALPKDDKDDRPVLPEAEYALAQAVNAYVSSVENQYSVEYAFPHGGKINNIFTTGDETRLVVMHSDYSFAIWDVEKREKLTEHVVPYYISHSAVSFDEKLLILANGTLYCYDCITGHPLWQVNARDYKNTSFGPDSFAVSDTAPVAVITMGDYLVILDTATGQVLQDMPMPTYAEEKSWSEETLWCYYIEYAKFSPDNRKVFLHLAGDESRLAICNLETGSFTITDFWFWSVDDAFFTEDGNVILIGKYRSRNGNYWIQPLYYYEDDYTEIGCINPEGDLLWADEIHYTEMDVGLGSECKPFIYPGDEGDIPAVAAVAGEKLMFYDIATGDLLEENAYTDAIVTLTLMDFHLSCVTVNGMVGQYSFEAKINMAGDFCIEDIDLAADMDLLENKWLFVSNSDTGNVLLYSYGLHDENWTEMPMDGELEDPSVFGLRKHHAGSTTLLTDYSDLSVPFVALDAEARTARFYEGLGEEFWNGKFMQGLSPDGKAILIKDYRAESDTYVAAYDLETGEYIPNFYELPAGWSDLVLQDGAIYFQGNIRDNEGLIQRGIIRQFDDGYYETVIVPTVDPDASLVSDALWVTHKGDDTVLTKDYNYTAKTQHYYTVNMQTSEVFHTDLIAYRDTTALWSADGQIFFVTEENCIIAFDRKCSELYRISCNGMTPGSLFASGEDLFVLYSDSVYRYRVSDGAFLNKIDVAADGSVILNCRWDNSQPGTLVLYNRDTLNLIDTERWVVRTHVDGCWGFDLRSGLIFTSQNKVNETMRFGYYEIYDYRQLIEMAREQLDGMTLSAEMRNKYGIT